MFSGDKMQARKKRKITSTIITVFAVVLILGLIGAIVMWLAREEGLTIYIKHADKRYTVNTVNNSLGKLGEESKFFVGAITGEDVEYTVSVAVNDKSDFEYVVNNAQIYKFNSFDCKNIFQTEKHTGYFLLKIPNDFLLTDALTAKHGGEISYRSAMPDVGEFFNLTVTTKFGKVIMPFSVAVGDRKYTDDKAIYVTITEENITF